MTEYKIGKATVRIHGTVNSEIVKTATERLAKQILLSRRKAKA